MTPIHKHSFHFGSANIQVHVVGPSHNLCDTIAESDTIQELAQPNITCFFTIFHVKLDRVCLFWAKNDVYAYNADIDRRTVNLSLKTMYVLNDTTDSHKIFGDYVWAQEESTKSTIIQSIECEEEEKYDCVWMHRPISCWIFSAGRFFSRRGERYHNFSLTGTIEK